MYLFLDFIILQLAFGLVEYT